MEMTKLDKLKLDHRKELEVCEIIALLEKRNIIRCVEEGEGCSKCEKWYLTDHGECILKLEECPGTARTREYTR
jgi:hypothetical protein